MRERLLPMLTAVGLDRACFRALEAVRAARRPGGDRAASDGIPLPPGRLLVGVGGTADPGEYLGTGAAVFDLMAGALGRAGTALSGLPRVLDFGCGCGRVLRHWRRVPGIRPHGVDVDPAMVAWCRQHLPFADVARSPARPPLALPSGSFDLVYAISVFTHLDRRAQRAWMGELARLLRPGGWLCLSVHGPASISRLDARGRSAFGRGEAVVRRPHASGTNLCAAYHPRDALRALLEPDLEIVECVPAGTLPPMGQDLYLTRRVPAAPDAGPAS